MKVAGKHYRTIWTVPDENVVEIIDQRWLPHEFVIERLTSVNAVVRAIAEMHVRGAGLIGVTAGYGMYLAAIEAPESSYRNFLERAAEKLKASRPTAVNLERAVDRQLTALGTVSSKAEAVEISGRVAQEIADEDAKFSRSIGEHGLPIIEEIASAKSGSEPVNILTHCNAGWLAFIDFGTATAPIYAAHDKGIDIHVWVDETRPRNQGARLTAWELGEHGVPYTVIPDNTGGHLMQHGMVDMVIVGSDRTTRTGYVANKIGTYLKALAAHDNDIPFYVALPSTSFDWEMRDGLSEIPIEERDADEVRYAQGLFEGKIQKVLLTPGNSDAVNFAFDVTPPRLITGLITERGLVKPNEEDLLRLFPEKRRSTS